MDQDRQPIKVDDVLPEVQARSEFDEKSNRAVAEAQTSAMQISADALEIAQGGSGAGTKDAEGDSGKSGSLGDARNPGKVENPDDKPGDTLTS